MSRLPVAAFAALVAATVGAFFLTQHLKVKNPYINGSPRVDPPVINPIAGRVCRDLVGKRVSFRRTSVSFYLQSHADTVYVYVVNSDNVTVATARGSGRYVRPNDRVYFSWDGREADGAVAPGGTYHFRVQLLSQSVSFDPPNLTVQVITRPPRPDVTGVRLTGGSERLGATTPILSPAINSQTVTIRFRRGRYPDSRIVVYRTDLPGGIRQVFAFGVDAELGQAFWNGQINNRPAPAGTYLIGMRVTDDACAVGRFPALDPPPAGSTPHAGVTVRYLAAEPPLEPTAAGATATVLVDSRLRPYRWALRAGATPRRLEHGSIGAARAAAGGGVQLRVPIPRRGAGIDELAIRAGRYRTVVPIVVSGAPSRIPAKVLVVLPALTWQGDNPVDDTGDGLPATLPADDAIALDRPLVDGLPTGLPDELGLLSYLRSQGDSFQLTTDIALATGAGPTLSGVDGVILDGSLAWLPSSLAGRLRTFVQDGGRVVSLGTGSLQAVATIRPGEGTSGPTAGPPARLSPDPFGAIHGPLVTHSTALIVPLEDHLGIFDEVPAVQGFSSYQQLTPPEGLFASEAGVADGASAITGFQLGRGDVVEIGLPGFGSSLSGDVDAQELFGNLWKLLSS